MLDDEDDTQRSALFHRDAIRLAHERGVLDEWTRNKIATWPEWRWDARAPRSVRKWNENALELERFSRSQGRTPKRNARHPGGGVSPEELRLHNWVRYQRRSMNTLCTYQITRLVRIPHFEFDPLEEAWDSHLAELGAFIAREGRHPSRHSPESEERRLGVWKDQQRTAARRGTLEYRKLSAYRNVIG